MRHPFTPRLPAALLAAVLLCAACSGIPLRERRAAELSRYRAYAGPPVRSLVWSTGYKRWTALSADTLLVWTNIEQPYLVRVFQPCADLLFARRIGVSSTLDAVQVQRDFVTADGWRCMIRTIRPIDYARLQRAQPAGRAPPAHRPQR